MIMEIKENGMLNESEYYEYGSNLDLDMIDGCSPPNSEDVDLILYMVAFILGFAGNSVVIIAYFFYKTTKSMSDIYLLNVAFADLLFSMALPLIVYNELTSWFMGSLACKMLRSSYTINFYGGMLLLACISGDRYIVIVQAHRSTRPRSPQQIHLICGIVWVTTFLLSVPTFIYSSWYEQSDGDFMNGIFDFGPPHYVCEDRLMEDATGFKAMKDVYSTQLAVGFFLPLLIMVFCFSFIIPTLMGARNFHQHKVSMVVLTVVVLFITCHLPYNVVLFYDTILMSDPLTCESFKTWKTTKTVTQTIAYMHCCLNPLLYLIIWLMFRQRQEDCPEPVVSEEEGHHTSPLL
ncbi:C-C chemokine receptor type 6a [Xyrichtys novacula]|uniref:C-C chemokine receptor type 6a n=1 Tax=Xyrichtys novacula TaxID=13765 RepID=A0AAV1GYC7_XYRNO|nr:C-C chemokine receptor type 6a [Xyrichtys novacula]